MYDMFVEHPKEQQLYRAIATVGSLLFELGEVGKKFKKGTPTHSAAEVIAASEVTEGSEVAGSQEDSLLGEVGKLQDMSEKVAGGDTANQSSDDFELVNMLADVQMVSNDAASGGTTPILVHPGGATPQLVTGAGDSPMRLQRPGSLTGLDKNEPAWEITFEQFLASMLTEPAIVDFFDERPNVIGLVDGFRQGRSLQRQTSELSFSSST